MFNKSEVSQPDAAGAQAGGIAAEGDTDAALVRRCQRGDADAFGRLFARHDKRVYALVARVLGPAATADDVDDVAQDVFVQAWRALPKFRGDAQFSTWLYRIGTNMAIRQWHRAKRSAQAVSQEDLPPTVRAALAMADAGPEDVAALRARDRALRSAVEGLPEKQRAVLLLHYFEGLPCEEVAALLCCSVGTVWSRLHYGCRRLRQTLGWLEE